MRERLTSSSLATLDRALRFGDLVVLPSEIDVRRQTEVGKALAREPWALRLAGSKDGYKFMPWILTHDLRKKYEEYRMRNRREPRWMRRMPSEFRRHARFSYYLGDGFDSFAIVLNIPYTGVGYAVEEGGLMEDAFHTFRLGRLGNIRQLAYLHDPLSEGLAMRFDQTRYCHVLDVMALATIMASRNGLPKREIRTLRVAAFTHDVLTPAGGDTTKTVDRKAFDEDLHYEEAFERFAAEPFLRRHRLSKKRLVDVIHNRGVLGKLLDLADKIAYVGRDAESYIHRVHPTVFRERERYPPSYRRLRKLVFREFPAVCGLWDSVVVDGDRVIVTDGERLGAFLELRARLFRDLYYSPAARFLEHTVASVIIRDLYETGILTRERLLTMEDWELDREIQLVSRFHHVSGMVVLGQDHAFVETFKTREEVERREDELEREGNYMVLVEEFVGATGNGTKIQTARNGRVASFAELYPERAECLDNIMKNNKPYRLYYFPIKGEVFTPWFHEAMARYRTRRAAARRMRQQG